MVSCSVGWAAVLIIPTCKYLKYGRNSTLTHNTKTAHPDHAASGCADHP